MTSDPSVINKLEELKIRFRERLKVNKDDVLSWQAEDRREELIHISHKLAGSSGTFGFEELSKEMRSFETDLYKTKDNILQVEELHALYQQFCAMIDKALSE